MGVPQDSEVQVGEVSLSIPDDIDGSGAALRGWLMSAGPEAPWRLLPAGSSDGQGPAETIGLVLDSAAATVALYDRVRLWLSRRKPREPKVSLTTVVKLGENAYKLTISLDPLEGG